MPERSWWRGLTIDITTCWLLTHISWMGLSFSRNFRYVGTYVFFYYSILYDLRLVCLTNKNEIRVQSLEYDLNTTTILNILGNKTCYFVTNMKLMIL